MWDFWSHQKCGNCGIFGEFKKMVGLYLDSSINLTSLWPVVSIFTVLSSYAAKSRTIGQIIVHFDRPKQRFGLR